MISLACAGRDIDASDAAARALALSSDAEPRVLAALANAVTALGRRTEDAEALTDYAFEIVLRLGHVDAFVTAYRGFPRLLTAVAAKPARHPTLATILTAADDQRLLRTAGRTIRQPGTTEPLSGREKEILSLVATGLRNREIARRLFISEVTVKAHMRNIMRKLNAKSRAHAVALAAEEVD